MSEDKAEATGPDLGVEGIALSALADGTMLQGHVGGQPVLIARRGEKLFALGAFCTHYGAPLVDGLLVDDTVRCPWHHACFDLARGEALCAPALECRSRGECESREGFTCWISIRSSSPWSKGWAWC